MKTYNAFVERYLKQSLMGIIRLVLVFILSGLLFVALYFVLKDTGIIGKFSNVTELKQIISSAGALSYSLYALLQFLQVTFVPLPASVTTIVGVILFGPIKAFVISLFAILCGSFVAYFLGLLFGNKILPWAVGIEKAKELSLLLSKGKIAFFLMMLFPFFPDDLLCLLAGVSKMDFKFFLITNLITRFLGLFCLCFIGSGIIHI